MTAAYILIALLLGLGLGYALAAARAAARAPGSDIPARVARLYAEWIIPLSRKIQVHGLLAAP